MKISRLLVLAALLAGSASLLTAGSGLQSWSRPAAPKPAPVAVTATVAPAADNHTAACGTVCTSCNSCSKKA